MNSKEIREVDMQLAKVYAPRPLPPEQRSDDLLDEIRDAIASGEAGRLSVSIDGVEATPASLIAAAAGKERKP